MKTQGVLSHKKQLTALMSLEGIGRGTFWRLQKSLIKAKLSFEDFWVGGERFWHKLSLNEKQIDSIKKFKKEYTINSYYESVMSPEVRVITIDESAYPLLLKKTVCAPPLLFVKSRATREKEFLFSPEDVPIAVVGARNMTGYGRMVTEKISQELVESGVTVVSGCMYGVDMTAHQSALAHEGKTVGVLGFGFNHVYPRQFEPVFSEMLEKGCVFVTEYAPSVSPHRAQFVQRNQVIAGMSYGVIITEAARKSGSHTTAEFAVEEGRSVFAVPGPITNPYSEGTKWLLNQGATLISSGQEVLSQLAPSLLVRSTASAVTSAAHPVFADPVAISIYDMLTTQPMSSEELFQALSHALAPEALSWSALTQVLSSLEINGSIMRNGAYYERI